MEVLIPSGFKTGTKLPFGDLIRDPGKMLRVGRMFESSLAKSFQEDERRMGKAFRERVQTQAEMDRRADIMARWFKVFRGDLGYSIARCEAEIYKALRSELDGELYTPPAARGSFGVPEGDIK